MKLKKYITAAVIVLAVAVIVGLNTVTRENLASPPVLITQAGEGGAIDFKVPQGGTIKEILFSSYGTPFIGSDGKPKRGTCHADTWIKRECEGKSPPTCTGILAHNNWWGDPCHGTSKKLMVSYTVTDPAAEAAAAAAAAAAAQRAEQERVAQAAIAASNAAAAQAAATVAAQRDAINAAAAAQIAAAQRAEQERVAAAANRTTGTAPSTTASTPVVSTPTRISEDKPTSTPPSAAVSTPTPAAASTASTPAPAAASTPAAAAVSTGKTSKEETDNTMMYVALGIGAVVLLLGVFMMSSRRQPAPVMAGRRR